MSVRPYWAEELIMYISTKTGTNEALITCNHVCVLTEIDIDEMITNEDHVYVWVKMKS